jgi:hypothetical protein
MSSFNDGNSNVTMLTQVQIETLQRQIRHFKELGSRFTDSKIPGMIDTLQRNQTKQQQAKYAHKDQVNQAAKDNAASGAASTAPAAPSAPVLSWQCFNSLLFCGPSKFPQDGAISFSSSVSVSSCIFVCLLHSCV